MTCSDIGLPAKQLHIIFCAIIVSRILYALPARGGYLPASLVSRIDAFLRKAFRFGYASQIQQLADLLSDADEQLFTKIGDSNHCLHQLLPAIKSIPMQLRDSQCLYMSFQSVTITYTESNRYSYGQLLRKIYDQFQT